MKFETMKKNNKKKILIGGLIGLSLVSVIGFTTTRAKYKSNQNVKLATGTVNWKQYDFKVMAMYQSENGTNYNEVTTMPGSGYTVNEEKSYCTTDNTTQVKGKIKTENGRHLLNNVTKSDKCYIYFDKAQITNAESLITNSHINIGSPDFSMVATTDEGIYQTSDGMYGETSYYWRGASTTNHVIFAEKCWRIVRINGDKTLRLIYNGRVLSGNTCFGNGANADSVIMGATKAEKYFATSDGQYNNASYVGWTYTLGEQRPADNATATPSNAKTQTEKWYKTNITDKGYDGKVATGKYCVDRNTGEKKSDWWTDGPYTTEWSATGTRFAYAAVNRVYNLHQPTLDCAAEDVYNLKVGAIIADEIEFAGGKNENNTSYYLYNGQQYWSMSPDRWDGAQARVFRVNNYGYLTSAYVHDYVVGLRPVINLNADTLFAIDGKGTADKPYVVQD